MNILHYFSGTSSPRPARLSRPNLSLASVTRLAVLGLLALDLNARGDDDNDFCGDLCPANIIQVPTGLPFRYSFGMAVAGLSSNTFLAGYQSEYENNVYIYTNGTWLATISDPVLNGPLDLFGSALASFTNGSYLVSAAHASVTSGFVRTNAGKVYLYSANNILTRTLQNAITNAEFGWSVASLEPNGILVGAPGVAAGTNSNVGIAYFYNTSGALLRTITNPAPRADDRFGAAVSRLGADKFLVGAPRSTAIPGQAGRVFLYGTNGSLLATLQNPNIRKGTVNAGFGMAVKEIGGGRFVVGAPLNDFVTPTATNVLAGTVYLYDNNGLLLKTINNPTPEFGQPTSKSYGFGSLFGTLLTALGTDRFAVSAPFRGRVYIYSLDGDLLSTLDAVDPAIPSRYHFGYALGTMGAFGLLVGAPGVTNGGRVYVYDTRLPEYTLGQEIPRPVELALTDVSANGPIINPPDAAYWHRRGPFDARLYATRPGNINITWNSSFAVQGINVWPTNASAFQTNIANCPPVDLTDGGRYAWTELKYTDLSTGTDPDNVKLKRQFQATGPGKSLLLLSAGPPSDNPIYFQLVNSLDWNNPAHLRDNITNLIGS